MPETTDKEVGAKTMRIDRDESIQFHQAGTLDAVTRWISQLHEGVAEWFKNCRAQYGSHRAAVAEDHAVAVLLLQDATETAEARIGMLDVGGATLEDVTLWSTWQDPDASSRGDSSQGEGNQGNGGKAFMYRLFEGMARIFGVRDGVRNCKGLVGERGSVERGTPGFVPSIAEGRAVPVSAWRAELDTVISAYAFEFEDLPEAVRTALTARQAFTIVEGVDPVGLYHGRIDVEDLLRKVLRHEQATLAVEQVSVYVIHNGRLFAPGPLVLDPIPPYEGFEIPRIVEIPEELALASGTFISTTEGGRKPKGRLVLHTSQDNMFRAHKNLRPRWKISYRADQQMLGAKAVGEILPGMAGSYFIYGEVELQALAPGYVDHGRRRPKDGPLMEALDLFIVEQIRQLGQEINECRRRDLDETTLDKVHEDNAKLDRFKNQFLPQGGRGGDGGEGEDGTGDPPHPPPPPPRPVGTVPDVLTVSFKGTLKVGKGVELNARHVLGVHVRDPNGRAVPNVRLQWDTSDRTIVDVQPGDRLRARAAGTAEVWATVRGTQITSPRTPVEVWDVEHVLLTPRSLEIPKGSAQEVIAEVTSPQGFRATDVYLNWTHDADDPLIVRIRPTGWVLGNRLGRTAISAGAGEPTQGGVWSRIPVEATVVPNPEASGHGGGFPQLLVTGRDYDPETGEVREGDPDCPALWQEMWDQRNNIWWLNLASREAEFAFRQQAQHPKVWRQFHVSKLIDMVVQVHMEAEYTRVAEERRDYWGNHKQAIDRHQVAVVGEMWDRLEGFVEGSADLD